MVVQSRLRRQGHPLAASSLSVPRALRLLIPLYQVKIFDLLSSSLVVSNLPLNLVVSKMVIFLFHITHVV